VTLIYRYENQCLNKRKFITRGDAKKSRKCMGSDLGVGHKRLKVYRCPHCEYFHIGNRLGEKVPKPILKGEFRVRGWRNAKRWFIVITYTAEDKHMTTATANFSDINYAQLPGTYSEKNAYEVIAQYKEQGVHASKHYLGDDQFGVSRFAICPNKEDLARLVGEDAVIAAYKSGELIF